MSLGFRPWELMVVIQLFINQRVKAKQNCQVSYLKKKKELLETTKICWDSCAVKCYNKKRRAKIYRISSHAPNAI